MLSEPDIKLIKAMMYEANSIAKWHRKKGFGVSYKSDNSPVTDADLAISEMLVKGLTDMIDIPVVSEEADWVDKPLGLFWLVDPIDGTSEYVCGENLYTVNIGLICNNFPLYGFISIPESNRLYYTPTPSMLKIEENEMEISVDFDAEELSAVISNESTQAQKSTGIMKQYGITRYQSIPCSVKFCLVASGEADLYPRYGETMEWDTAAGGALINASGGTTLGLDGKLLSYGKENLVNKGFIAYSKRLAEAQRLR